MNLSLTDAQITLLRLAKRHLILPAKSTPDADPRNDLALLVLLELVEGHEGGFRLTEAGAGCVERLEAEHH